MNYNLRLFLNRNHLKKKNLKKDDLIRMHFLYNSPITPNLKDFFWNSFSIESVYSQFRAI